MPIENASLNIIYVDKSKFGLIDDDNFGKRVTIYFQNVEGINEGEYSPDYFDCKTNYLPQIDYDMELIKYLGKYDMSFDYKNGGYAINIDGQIKKLKEVIFEFVTGVQCPKGYIVGFKERSIGNLRTCNMRLMSEEDVKRYAEEVKEQIRKEKLIIESKSSNYTSDKYNLPF